jgi:uncharacterized Zn finger protein
LSYIIFDFICKECGEQYPDKMVRRSEINDQRCEKCGNVLHQMPAGPITTFRFGDRAAIKSRKAVSLRDKH